MASISLCMIVKNEEEVLARCLECVKHIVDEIIIVDTGSTDQTKEIAARYTDKIYDYEWIDNFADARNFSFSKATKEYIYCADADEIIDKQNQIAFIHLKKSLLPEIDIVQMHYCNQLEHGTVYNYDKELRPKLFKRQRSFRWIEPVHETVALEPLVYDSDIEIIHCPISSHASRDFHIFESITAKGEEMSARLRTFYAKELLINGNAEDFQKAIPAFTAVFECDTTSDELLEASCILARAYRLSGNISNMFKYALKNVMSEGCAELCFELGEYYRSIGDDVEAGLWYYNAAFESPALLNIHFSGDFALDALSKCYERLGNADAAEHYAQLCEEWKNANHE